MRALESMLRLYKMTADFYAERFSDQELRGLIAFFETSVGQKYYNFLVATSKGFQLSSVDPHAIKKDMFDYLKKGTLQRDVLSYFTSEELIVIMDFNQSPLGIKFTQQSIEMPRYLADYLNETLSSDLVSKRRTAYFVEEVKAVCGRDFGRCK